MSTDHGGVQPTGKQQTPVTGVQALWVGVIGVIGVLELAELNGMQPLLMVLILQKKPVHRGNDFFSVAIDNYRFCE